MSKPARPKGISVQVGRTEVTKIGIARFSRHDAYHLILSLSWAQFFFGAILVYMWVNVVFATAYFLGTGAINNAHPGSFSDCFFFSVETLATVGYGNMSPGTFYGHVIATMEIITGMLSMAVITSLVFARFSKPTARILFSRVAVITPYDGVPTLMLRAANQRRGYILEAAATMMFIRDTQTAEGHKLRRFYDLKLERARSPMFALSWTIMHKIDETSPLYGLTAEDFEAGDMRFGVTLTGVDETFAANITARYSYSPDEILFDRRFVDIVAEGEHDQHVYLHLDRFHDLEPVETNGPA